MDPLEVAAGYGVQGGTLVVLVLLLREVHNLRTATSRTAERIWGALSDARERLRAVETRLGIRSAPLSNFNHFDGDEG